MSMEMVTAVCVIVGAVISLVVSAAKKVSFVADNPKLVAMVVSVVVSIIMGLLGMTEVAAEAGAVVEQPDTWKMIALCAVEQFTAAVATYEVATKALANRNTGPDV